MSATAVEIDLEELLEDSVACNFMGCGAPAQWTLISHHPACFMPSGYFACTPCVKKSRDHWRDEAYVYYGDIQCEICLNFFSTPESFVRFRRI